MALSSEPTTQLLPVAEALRALQGLHRRRNDRPVADTITLLLEHTRGHVGFVLRPAGEQALANVLHVAELGRQYEAAGGISFRGFIDALRSAAELEGAEAPILEEGSDGVRLMTVHKAKGLEFPVVILADLTCRISRSDASRYLDLDRGLCAMKIGGWAPHELHEHETEEVMRDKAEGVRLAYVAATRARDLLVVPALGDEPWEGGWISPLNRALYPPLEARRTATRSPKCPAFKSKDTVLVRPNEETAGSATVCPGLHRFPEGYSVVWWEPGPGGGLTLGLKPSFGVRREDPIVKDVSKSVTADGKARYDQWRLARSQARRAGLRPSMAVTTVGEWTVETTAVDPPGSDPAAVSILDLTVVDPGSSERAGGAAFGVLVHAVLARVPFDATTAEVAATASLEARTLGLDATAATWAIVVVGRVFAHDLMVRARVAEARGACRRETPLTCLLPGGTLVEGVVDLAFEESGRWLVVDFKTDRQFDAEAERRYRRQVSLYASAIALATGQPADGVIVRV